MGSINSSDGKSCLGHCSRCTGGTQTQVLCQVWEEGGGLEKEKKGEKNQGSETGRERGRELGSQQEWEKKKPQGCGRVGYA